MNATMSSISAMGAWGLLIVIVIVLILVGAASIKYLFFNKRD